MKVNIVLVSLFIIACNPTKKELPSNPSELKPGDGWNSLFDGKSLNGWRIFKDKPNTSWEVNDGTLHCKPFEDGVTNHRSDLMTKNQYENFELIFQWKISAQGNSGVMFRVSEEYDEPYATGPEYQLLDDEGYPGETKPTNVSASNFDMHAPDKKNANPVGEWNESKIVVNGNAVQHWLNGLKVVDYELYSDDWMERKNASKWKDFPGYATITRGHIVLQDHGNEVWFKDIMIRVIE